MRENEKITIIKARALRRDMTRAEVLLWYKLRRKQLAGYKFRRQVPIGPYIADFACVAAHLVIEVDGETHSKPEEITRDGDRTQYINKAGWHIHRIWNTDVYENMSGVLEGILYQLNEARHN